MVQSKKKGTDNRPEEKAPRLKAEARKGRWTAYIIVSVVVIIILIVVGVFYYQEYVAPFRITVIKIDDTSINMDYFLKRTKMHGADAFTMLDALSKEQVIKLGAPQYVGEVTGEDVDQEMRRVARGASETITESEFKEWYRQQVNESELSDAEFREYVSVNLLAARLHEYLAARVPTVAEQIHLHAILVETSEDAEKIRARWETGENFADLALEVSLDEASREKGGDIGWFPRGVLSPTLDYAAFELATDNVSQPIPYVSDMSDPSATIQLYYLLMVSEKADARQIDEGALGVLRDNALADWLSVETQLHDVSYHGFNNGFDSETYNWMNWQLAKE